MPGPSFIGALKPRKGCSRGCSRLARSRGEDPDRPQRPECGQGAVPYRAPASERPWNSGAALVHRLSQRSQEGYRAWMLLFDQFADAHLHQASQSCRLTPAQPASHRDRRPICANRGTANQACYRYPKNGTGAGAASRAITRANCSSKAQPTSEC